MGFWGFAQPGLTNHGLNRMWVKLANPELSLWFMILRLSQVPQIQPLADIVHFKYAHTYLLTYILLSLWYYDIVIYCWVYSRVCLKTGQLKRAEEPLTKTTTRLQQLLVYASFDTAITSTYYHGNLKGNNTTTLHYITKTNSYNYSKSYLKCLIKFQTQ